MNELRIMLEIPAEIAEVCCRSIGIEAESEALSRSKVDLKYDGDYLKLDITARDLGAMRAALNTYLRWIIMCHDLLRIKNNLQKG